MTGMIPAIVFCIVPLMLGMLTIAITGTRARIKMAGHLLLLREYGLYPAWEKQNKWVIVLNQGLIWVAILSFWGALIFARINTDLARALFVLFAGCGALALLASGLHYWRVMRVRLPPWTPPPANPKHDFRNMALVLGVTGLVIFVARKLGLVKDEKPLL